MDDKKKVSIIVIADTHVSRLKELPTVLQVALKEADHIVHLGDYTSLELVRELRELGGFYGVAGNHDDLQIKRVMGGTEVLTINGKKIGLIHGMYFPFGTQRRMKSRFRNHKLDVLLYGHSHEPGQKMLGDTLLLNPGTASGQFPSKRASFGILTIDGSINGEIIYLEYKVPWGGLFHRVRAILLRKTIVWIQTWPYLDVAGPVKSIFKAAVTFLKKSFLLSRMNCSSEKEKL